MKNLFFIAILLASTASMAQSTLPTAPMPPTMGVTSSGHGAGQMQHEQRFSERKAEILQRLNKRMSEIQAKQDCVQAAANPQSLKACFPNMGERNNGGSGFPEER